MTKKCILGWVCKKFLFKPTLGTGFGLYWYTSIHVWVLKFILICDFEKNLLFSNYLKNRATTMGRKSTY